MAARDAAVPGTVWRSARQYLALQARLSPAASDVDRSSVADQPAAAADVVPKIAPDIAPHPASATFVPAMSPLPPTRFGFTVGKRNARLSVDRNLVRRVLREAARHAAPALDAAVAPGRIDIVLRLKSALPPKSSAARVRLRADLRAEADSLLAQLTAALRAATAAHATGRA